MITKDTDDAGDDDGDDAGDDDDDGESGDGGGCLRRTREMLTVGPTK